MKRKWLTAWSVALFSGILIAILWLPGRADDPARGRALFERRCSGCHALDTDKEGPRLRGVYGRASAAVKSFNYSEALTKAHLTWDAPTLDRWLADPQKTIPDNDMAFQVSNADERANLIAYLKEISAR